MNRRTVLMGLAILVAIPGTAWAGPDPAGLVAAVDEMRMPDLENSLVGFTLQSRRGGRVEEPFRYELRSRPASGSLVSALDGDQRGQKYLSTSKGYWLFTPRTRRAIRLTPLQLVRGQASIGDISRMRFARDYRAVMDPQAAQVIDNVDCWALQLKATSPQATYASVALYVAKADGRPVRANLFSAAGRKLKTVRFGPVAAVSGRRVIQATTFEDALDSTKSTVMRLGSIARANTPDAMFTPQALSLN